MGIEYSKIQINMRNIMKLKICFKPILIGLIIYLASFPVLAQETTIKFDGLEDVYHVGDTVTIDLVEITPPYRTENVDLWFAVQMPTNELIFITSTANIFNLPEPFQKNVETTETEHRLLVFEVPPGFDGSYTLYALYVEAGKDPLVDGIENVDRSNLALKTVTLCDEPSKNPFMCDSPPPIKEPFRPSFTFTPISHATPNVDYISNPIVVSEGENATIIGGNATLIKNGVNSGLNSIAVVDGDIVTIKTRSSANGSVNLTLKVGDKSTNWSVNTDAIKLPSDIPGTQSGYTSSEFNVNESGAATYSIPITVSPGTAGIQPNLSIAYSSQGSNGLLGMGWSLGGLSAISRCPATLAQDNFIDPVDFDDNDRFCLDGERLMAVQGIYGEDSTIYYTEQNTFKKVVSYGKAGNGPEKFTVQTKSGLIMEFGYTADSRIEAQGKDSILLWTLNKIQDTKGNYLTVFYEENNANGEYHVKSIKYTGNVNTDLTPYNSVQFFYEARQDVVPKYIGGSQIKNTQRLSRVEAWEGADVFRKYNLSYEQSKITQRSLLISVQECGIDGSCFVPTTFEWQKQVGDKPSEAFFSTHQSSYNIEICTNNLINTCSNVPLSGGIFKDITNSPFPTFKGSTEGSLKFPNIANNTCSEDLSVVTGRCDSSDNFEYILYPDINGDGLKDLCYRSDSGIQCYLNIDDKWQSPIITDICANSSVEYGGCNNADNWDTINFIDVNTDGKQDLVFRSDSGMRAFISTGNSFELFMETSFCQDKTTCDWDNYPYIQYPDINGDGQIDLCYRADKTGITCYLNNSQGWEFDQPIQTNICANHSTEYGICESIDNWDTINFIDVNSDGRDDLVFRSDSGMRVFAFTGSSFELSIETEFCKNGNRCDYDNYQYLQYPDINGDSKVDLCYRSDYGIECYLNDGLTWDWDNKISSDICANHSVQYGTCNDADNYDTIRFIDLNSDGKQDLVFRSDQGLRAFTFTGNGFSSILASEFCKNGDCNSLESLNYIDINGDELIDLVSRETDGLQVYTSSYEEPSLLTFTNENTWISGAYGDWHDKANRIYSMDVNVDGLTDIVIGPDDKGEWFVLKNTGFGFIDEGAWISGAYGNWHDKTNRIRPMDVNADGLPDILIGPDNKGEWFVLKNTGSSFVDEGAWISGAYGYYHDKPRHIHPMDINADGLADIVIGPSETGKWFVLKNTGSGFVDEGAWITGAYGNWNGSLERIYPMDMNADGLPDILIGPGGDGKWYVLKNTGSSFVDEGAWITGAYGNWDGAANRIYPMDVNTDGLPDIVIGPGGDGMWYVLKNTGSSFIDEGAWITGAYGKWDGAASRIRPMDVNTDGLPDIVIGPGGDGKWYVLKNTGSSFVDEGVWISEAYGNWDGSPERIRPMDVNGDGLADIMIGPNDKGEWFVIKADSKPLLLNSIISGNGTTTSINYNPLTDTSVYTKQTNAQYPQQDFIGPIYVASKISSDDGIGGQQSISYHYEGGKVDLNGRGFRGFSKVTQIDDSTGIKHISFYERDYRYISTKIKRTETSLADGTLLAESDNTASLKDYGNGVHFSRVDKSISKSYELDGSLVSTKITTNQYDDYGNPTQIVVDNGNGYIETTTNTYTNDIERWILGRLTRATVTKTALGQPAQTRTSAFEYDTESGILNKEIVEPDYANFRLEKTYQHDTYGNIQVSSISGIDIETRSHRTVYDSQGRYVITSENALGHQETKTYNMGNLTSLTGPNNLVTSWQYDGFGRPLLEIRADGTQTRTAYRLCNENCPPLAKYFVHTETSGAAPTIVYHDILDREIRRETVGFDGQAIYVDKQYNSQGEVTQVSDPYFAGEAPLWTVNKYDVINRPIQQIAPDGGVTKNSYQGLTTVITNALAQTNSRTVNVIGKLARSVDNTDNSITYIYDGFGNLIELRDPNGNTTTMQYDLRGNKTSMYDADTGTTKYSYNVLGKLLSQTDSKSQTVTMGYDKLGRMIQRKELGGISTWEYDTQIKGIGKLAWVTGPNDYKAVYDYDSFGRLIRTSTVLNSQTFFVSKTYDQYSRADTLTYPTGFAIQNEYNQYGYLTKVQRISDNKLFWQAEQMNARGQLEQIALGNGLITKKAYGHLTGRVQSIETGDGNFQNLSFQFDKLGNLKERANRKLDLAETFQYDELNRLTETDVSHFKTSLEYDKLGNIVSKSDVGNYIYGENGAGPHAVTSIEGAKSNQYTYDTTGNRIAAKGQVIDYNSFNKPISITQNNKVLEFQYGPDYSRYQQTVTDNGFVNTTTYVAGGLFEREVSQAWEKHTHYIFVGKESVAIYTEKNHGIKQETRYLHKDHLGSIDTITDETGRLVEKFSFDAWGQRRDAETWGALTEAELLEIIKQDLTTDRGFTGHEHLDEVQLIHTNGRLYDPVIGRFLSADPYVQAPTSSQSLNRYSYVLNNPLSIVDPSGFFFKKLFKAIGKAFKKIGNFIKKYWKTILSTVVGVVLSAITGGLASGLVGSILSGAGFGFGAAFSGTLLNGGSFRDAFKAGLMGGLIGGVATVLTSGVGDLFSGHAAKAVAHGVVGGITRVAQGGRFEHGFLSGAFSSGFGSMVNNISNKAGRVVASAVIGGTAEKLGGGKFANGAVTGAFVRLFNDERHRSFSEALDSGVMKGAAYGGAFAIIGNRIAPVRSATFGIIGFAGGFIKGVWDYNKQFNQQQNTSTVQQEQTLQHKQATPIQQQKTVQQKPKICQETCRGIQCTVKCW